MHGVGETLAGLSDFIGLRFIAVDDYESIVYFRFATVAEAELRIGVESEWTIRDESGGVVTNGQPRPSSPIPQPPLYSRVIAAETEPPTAIVLRLSSGHTLHILDTSDQYESFCIPHANVYV